MTTKKSEILTAIHEIMKEVGYVQKKDRNEFHKYNYAGEAALLEVLRPAMLKHGLILIPSGESISEIDINGNTHVAIDYTLAHISGEVWPEKVRAFGSGNDKNSKGGVGDKGTYKALTGANKYMLFKLFQIETGDDPEAEGKLKQSKKMEAPLSGVDDIPLDGRITEKQRIRLQTIATKNNWETTAVKSLIAKHGFSSSKDILKGKKYDAIIDELEHGMEEGYNE